MTMADGSAYAPDLALQRAQDAAQSKMLAQKAAADALAAIGSVALDRAAIDLAKAEIVAKHQATMQLASQVRADLLATQILKADVVQLIAALRADQVVYDDSQTHLGAATVAEAISELLLRVGTGGGGGGGAGGQLDFSDPNNSGLLPAI